MRGVLGALALLLAFPVLAQDAASYAAAENPFQAEYAYVAGQPIVLRTEVAGVRFDSFTLTAPAPASPDAKVSCDLALDGSNQGDKKVTVTAVFLLEGADGKGLEKLSMSPFKIKSGRPFTRSESLTAQGRSLTAAGRIYIFIKID